MSEKTVRAMGIAWYREEDWDAIKRVMVDSDKLHARYEDWLKVAEKLFNDSRQGGRIVERAYIDPAEFAGWCALRGLNVDAQARQKFCAEFVAKKHRYSN